MLRVLRYTIISTRYKYKYNIYLELGTYTPGMALCICGIYIWCTRMPGMYG